MRWLMSWTEEVQTGIEHGCAGGPRLHSARGPVGREGPTAERAGGVASRSEQEGREPTEPCERARSSVPVRVVRVRAGAQRTRCSAGARPSASTPPAVPFGAGGRGVAGGPTWVRGGRGRDRMGVRRPRTRTRSVRGAWSGGPGDGRGKTRGIEEGREAEKELRGRSQGEAEGETWSGGGGGRGAVHGDGGGGGRGRWAWVCGRAKAA